MSVMVDHPPSIVSTCPVIALFSSSTRYPATKFSTGSCAFMSGCFFLVNSTISGLVAALAAIGVATNPGAIAFDLIFDSPFVLIRRWPLLLLHMHASENTQVKVSLLILMM